MGNNSHSHDDDSQPSETEAEANQALEDEDDELSQPDELDLALPGAPAVDVQAPDQIIELYGLCLEYVKRALGIELDFTDETLPILDHYLTIARTDIEGRPELARIVYTAVGAYFGELIRRRVNGFWSIPNPDYFNWRVCARHVFLSLNPIGAICEALAQSEEHEGPSAEMHLAPEDRELVAERLANAPPVPEGEYYLLSTRLEALDITVEILRLAMQTGGHSSVEFEIEDYESANY